MIRQVTAAFFVLLGTVIDARGELLVRFGASEANNEFGRPGWSTVIRSPDTIHTNSGNGGLTWNRSFESGFYAYHGVVGNTPISLSYGDKVVATWYNAGSQRITFTPLVSFTDHDEPNQQAGQPQWFAMRLADETQVSLNTGARVETEFCIHFASPERGFMNPSAGSYTSVNVSGLYRGAAIPQSFLLLEKIEVFHGVVDTEPPSAPSITMVTTISDSAVELEWTAATDNIRVHQYRIYANDVQMRVLSGNILSDTLHLLKPLTDYSIKVEALDANGNRSAFSNVLTVRTHAFPSATNRINPHTETEYLGAFRVPPPSPTPPGENQDHYSWAYSRGGLAYRPEGDPDGAEDGFPGSLFGNGHNRRRHFTEINIPVPVVSASKRTEDLNRAHAIQQFTEVSVNLASQQITTGSLAYIPMSGGSQGGKLFACFGDEYPRSGKIPFHFQVDPDFQQPNVQGPWYLGEVQGSPRVFTYWRFIMDIPAAWATAHTGGRRLVAGGQRQVSSSGMGPSLYAFLPWVDAQGGGNLPENAEMSFRTLLKYDDFGDGDSWERSMVNFQHSDSWDGGVWLDTGTASVLVLAGQKSRGREWYGYMDGTRHGRVAYDIPDVTGGEGKGPKTENVIPTLLFFDPADFEQVLAGTMPTHGPQPYAAIDLTPWLFNPSATMPAISCDRARNLVYVMESSSLIHVFRIGCSGGANTPPSLQPIGDKTITAGQQLSFGVSAVDPDSQILSFSAEGTNP